VVNQGGNTIWLGPAFFAKRGIGLVVDEGAGLFPEVLGQAQSKMRDTGNKLPPQCPPGPDWLTLQRDPSHTDHALGRAPLVISQKWCRNSFPDASGRTGGPRPRCGPLPAKGSSIAPRSVVRRSGLASIRMDRLRVYNEQRPHWGYRTRGRTPAEVFWGVASQPKEG